jgi:hypothetical protein
LPKAPLLKKLCIGGIRRCHEASLLFVAGTLADRKR